MKLSKNALQLNIKRTIELSERGKEISTEISKLCAEQYFYRTYNSSFNLQERIEKGVSIYKNKYKESLTNEEITILALYIIIPDDKKLIEYYIRANKNLQTVANNFCVTEKFIAFRLKTQIRINEINKIKKLIKEKKEEK